PRELIHNVTNVAEQLYAVPEDRNDLLQMITDYGPIKGFETQFYKKDGSVIHVSINMHAIKDEEGGINYVAYAQDVTASKMMEEERREAFGKLRKSLGATVRAMAMVVETKDPYTAGHQRRVADLARAIANEMNLTVQQIDGIRMASVIHDIGKIAVPAEILSKPSDLSHTEQLLIQEHAIFGYNILKDIEFPWPIARMVLEHHERIDGSGYPNGLKDEDLLLESKIIAVADVVEAIASYRPYRPAHGLERALEEIDSQKGILYDSVVADACLRLFREKGYTMVV
ncbi:MAG: HD domain-containing protein, partial [Smithellaceae bacterium]|nr:HD domain-containing protein [Smithellaceae bacterium]